jgi:uncharacterized protein
LLIFVAAMAAIFISAGVIVLRWMIARVRQRHIHLSRPSRMVVVLAVIGVFCMAYGYYIEPYWPSVTHQQIRTPKFPKGSGAFRIVQISDVHSDPEPRLEERLPEIIREQRPELIIFTGDATNRPAAVPVFHKLMSDLARIAPTYVVRGNWDESESATALFGGTGVTELQGMPYRVRGRNNSVVISGTATDDPMSVQAALLYIPKGEFRIFVHHFPDRIYEVAKEEVDLYLAGHTHGGQVALPVYGALLTFSKFDKRFESGRYEIEKTTLYVNRGIGMEGGRAPRVRFWARPEITVFDIMPAE